MEAGVDGLKDGVTDLLGDVGLLVADGFEVGLGLRQYSEVLVVVLHRKVNLC